MIRGAALAVALVLGAATHASAQPAPFDVTVAGAPIEALGSSGIVVAVDSDDDDEDGVHDAAQDRDIPSADLLPFEVIARSAGVEVRAEGGIRIVRDGRPLERAVAVRRGDTTRLHVQGVRASRRGGDAALVLEGGGRVVRLQVTAVALAFLAGPNRRLDAARDAVGVSHSITNDATLPRGIEWQRPAGNDDDVRLEIWDPSASGDEIRAVVEAGPPGGAARTTRTVSLRRPRAGAAFRSPWLRFVGDEMDQLAPGVGDRVIRVALRDEVRIRYPESPRGGTQSMRVGRPGDEDGPRAARRGRLRLRILRAAAGGMPVVGGNDATAIAVGRRQIAIANEIWVQCFAGFGDPAAADVAVVDPPPRALVAIADRDGLPARGGGTIRLAAGGRAIRPVTTRAGALPVETALALAEAIRELGLSARVTENARAEHGAGRSADVVVRDAQGAPVELAPDGTDPLCTDARQSVKIGGVDLSDGLQEFDNMTASAGTLEERTLVKTLSDDDSTTVDLFVVNHFTGGTRQGEAFIEADGGSIVNTLILDRNGVRQEREAWTQAHELGHILLNQPYHPDNVGPDRPWLLMDADSSLGLVTGPKRLSWDECHRARAQSGAHAVPPILDRADPRPATPTPPAAPYDPGYPRE